MAKNTGRDDSDDIDDDDDDDEEQLDASALVKKLRADVKRLSRDAKDKTELQRELAFTKAGIDTDSKLGKMFAKSFEGDITDIDGIKAEAAEIGLVKVESPEGEGGQKAEDGTQQGGKEPGKEAPAGDQSTKERQALASGATPDDGSGVDPRKTGLDEATKRIGEGATFEEGASSMLGQLVGAAMSGDQRVIVKGRIESD